MRMMVSGVLAVVLAAGVAAGAPGANKPSEQELRLQFAETSVLVERAAGSVAKALKRENREETRKTLEPLLKKRVGLAEDLLQAMPGERGERFRHVLVADMAFLSALGDADTKKILEGAAGGRGEGAFYARLAQLQAKWYESAEDEAAQKKVLEDLKPLIKAQPANDTLANSLVIMSMHCAASKEVSEAANQIVMKELTGERAKSHQLFPHMNKPYTIVAREINGKPFTSAALKGKVVVVHVWSAVDPRSRAEMPDLAKLLSENKEKGLVLLGAPVDDEKALAAYLRTAKEITWPQLYNAKSPGELKARWGFQFTNQYLVIDRAGLVRGTRVGRGELDKLVETLLAEKVEEKGAEKKDGN